MSDIDDMCQILCRGIGLNFEDLAEEIIAAGFHRDSTVTTTEELDALPVGSVVVEGDHTTPDMEWFGIATIPGVFHRFPAGWYVVAGHGARDVPLPATVLHEGARDE
jgi:hypothetical protein